MPGERRDASISDANGGRLTGYAARYNSPTVIASEFTEIIAPGAFTNSLRTNDILALLDHDGGRLLGRTSSGTLRLREDKHGLVFDLDVAGETADGRAALSLVARKDLFGMSFGFFVLDEDWDYDGNGLPTRTIRDLYLDEISVVSRPAYPSTFVSVASRSADVPAATAGRADNAAAARRRVARRRALMEHKFRGIA
jgi:HK97 family phage prohead protease